MQKKIRFFILTSALLAELFLPTANASAAEPEQLGTFGNWEAYTVTEQGSKVCYMLSRPMKAQGKYASRGDIYAIITHRPAQKTKDVFSYITGYTYKDGSDATVAIDGKRYILLTQGDTAWAPDAAADSSLAQAIQSGSSMIVKGTSTRGTVTTDTFSLKGSGSAYDAISRACST